MLNFTTFYVDKTTQTFADTLTAFGFSRLLRELLERQGEPSGDVRITDKGAYYELVCKPALQPNTLEYLDTPIFPIRFIQTLKNAASLPTEQHVFDYEMEKQRVNEHYEARRKGVAVEDLPDKSPYWDILRAINPTALPGYTSLLMNAWQTQACQAEVFTLLFDLFSSTPNNVDEAQSQWQQLDKAYGWGIKPVATGQQLYNPDQGKGQNKQKSDGMSVGNQSGFWLVEWLKAIGFYEVALTQLVRGAKDRKTFVVAPRNLSFEDNQHIMPDFMNTMSSEASTRFDILAVIRYTQSLLKHFSQDDTTLARILGKSIQRNVVAGFHTAFYKDLGNAVATMNISFIALPGWVEVQSRADVPVYNFLLEELKEVTRQFDESHSDAFTLLQYLRDFVSGNDLQAFFRFTNAFPAYYIGMRERGKYARQLTTTFVERLMMSTDKPLSEILASPGFQNIAYAIRQSTVTAQYRKGQGDRKYDVRYGLGQALNRKARYPQQFITELSDFLHKYNAENAQVMENRPGPYRRSIKTTDIDEIVGLIDTYGGETVANLLIAYGYARVPREENLEEQEQAS